MLEGNRFLPVTGTPIWKIVRMSTILAVWEPEPLTVATSMEKSFTSEAFSKIFEGPDWVSIGFVSLVRACAAEPS